MKSIEFCKRTVKEILRDPLSYIFCLGFPIIMLIIMTIVNASIPAEAGMVIFQMDNLAPGMAFFGLSFVMIFICIQVANDRSSTLLMRLHASPMKSVDFIVGYTFPALIVALLQVLITYATALVISALVEGVLSIGGIMVSVPFLIPSMLFFVGVGLLLGTVFNEKAAPGACSVLVTVGGMLGGVWMPVDTMGGTILKISKCMPFYHGVKIARLAVSGDIAEGFSSLGIILLWAVGIYACAVVMMKYRMKKDVC